MFVTSFIHLKPVLTISTQELSKAAYDQLCHANYWNNNDIWCPNVSLNAAPSSNKCLNRVLLLQVQTFLLLTWQESEKELSSVRNKIHHLTNQNIYFLFSFFIQIYKHKHLKWTKDLQISEIFNVSFESILDNWIDGIHSLLQVFVCFDEAFRNHHYIEDGIACSMIS